MTPKFDIFFITLYRDHFSESYQKSTRKRCGHADSEITHSDKKEKKDRYLRNVHFESRGPERGQFEVLFCPFSDKIRGRHLCLLILIIFSRKKSYEEINNFVNIIKICTI